MSERRIPVTTSVNVDSVQKECLKKSANLCNEIVKIPVGDYGHDDLNDLRHHIHAIQNILYTQLYIKEHGQV